MTYELHPPAPLSKNEARTLTEAIRAAVDALWELLLEAHERQAWKALGYSTWAKYVECEFDMSRAYSYRLLDQGRVIRALEDAAGESVAHGRQISEREARDLKPILPEVTEEIRTRVEAGADPLQTTYEVIEAKREERKPAAEPVQPEPEPDDYEPDYRIEFIEADKRIREQERLIESLSSSDLAREVASWQQRYMQLEGRLGQQITTANEAQKQAQYYADVLKKIRKELGVEQTQQILQRIRQLTGKAAA